MNNNLLDLDRPLPSTGLHLIEASAGTGKTYALATLALRAITELHVPTSGLLMVTFTRSAAGELRARVRGRMALALSALDGATAPSAASIADDELIQRLIAHDDRADFAIRLRTAMRDFDQATITTIHSFSQQVLTRSGLATNPRISLRADLMTVESDVIANRVAAVALRSSDTEPLPGIAAIVEGLTLSRNHPSAVLRPTKERTQQRLADLAAIRTILDRHGGTPTDLDSADAADIIALWERSGINQKLIGPRITKDPFERLDRAVELALQSALAPQIVQAATDDLSSRLQNDGELGFADLLAQAEELVRTATHVRDELRSRWSMIFVDEFQDTDPVQWRLFQAIAINEHQPADTGSGGPAMIIVGDPKQAIYRFRGGDIDTYLDAKEQTQSLTQLTTNYRSTPQLVDSLNLLFDQTTFGQSITYVPVTAAPTSPARTPSNEQSSDQDLSSRHSTKGGTDPTPPEHQRQIEQPVTDQPMPPVAFRSIASAGLNIEAQRRVAADDLAMQVQAIAGTNGIRYSDIAVLYKAHSNAPTLLNALSRRGIPAAITRGESLLDSHAVRLWRLLLCALERPTDARRVRAAALSPLLPHKPRELLDPDTVRNLQRNFLDHAATLERAGVAQMYAQLSRQHRSGVSVLAAPDGERLLVDLEHVGELLHLATNRQSTTATALIETLDELVFTDPDDVEYAADLTKRRLATETNEDVVKLMSMHASKGLEFRVVCCPTLWTKVVTRAPYHFVDDDRTPVLLFGSAEGDPKERSLAATQALEESARLAYVAATRAEDHLLIWWPDVAPTAKGKITPDFGGSGFAQLMQERAAADAIPAESVVDVLRSLAERHPEQFSFDLAGTAPSSSFGGEGFDESSAIGVAAADLAVAKLDHALDRTTERLSFSSITSRAFPYEDRSHDTSSAPESHQDQGARDENPDEVLDVIGLPTDTDRAEHQGVTNEAAAPPPNLVPLSVLPAGKEPGTKLHEIFEHLDFVAPEPGLTKSVASAFGAELEPTEQALVVEGMTRALATPLGPDLGDMSLNDISRADRVDEMQFDLPLRTGFDQSSTLPALSATLLSHLDPSHTHHDTIRTWAEGLAHPAATVRLGGFLTGSIDLLFRYRESASGATRYIVADYKSNKIARWPEQMTPEVYAAGRLASEMAHGQYLLQALLYLVATHRFLRQRIDGYDPDRHLGPACYLFVRGMTGETNTDGAPNGVFTWRPSTALLLAVEKLLLEDCP